MKPCIVVFDDEQGLCCPYGFDEDCEGALCADKHVVVFPNRKAARAAIAISKKWAELCKLQGLSHNDDFTECMSCIKVIDATVITDEVSDGA